MKTDRQTPLSIVSNSMGSEINHADGGEVQDQRDGGDSGNTRVPKGPQAATPPTSLRLTKSMPADLASDDLALAVRSTEARPAPSSSWLMKGLSKMWTWRKAPRSIDNGEMNQPVESPADNTDGEEPWQWTSPYTDPHKVYGFDEELQALESFVRREDNRGFRAVAVVGSRGIGKTTLCQLLFNEERMKEDFVPRIWVSNSRQPGEDGDLKTAIVRRMLMHIGEDETEDMDLDKLMALLHRNLWGKKYLIILDDARDADPWFYNLDAAPDMDDDWKNRLAYGLPKGSGGRVVVISRNEEEARKIAGEHNLHRVIPLSNPDDCWSIFEESVGLELEAAMKREIYEKSAGIPLAIKIMAVIMKEQRRESSENITKRTESI